MAYDPVSLTPHGMLVQLSEGKVRMRATKTGQPLLACFCVSLALALAGCGGGGGGDGAAEPASANQASLELLGKNLFEDANLSEPAGQSCATCHDATHAFTDPHQNLPTSQGVHPGLFGKRNTPTAAYAQFSPAFHYDVGGGTYVGGQFLDGRAAMLEGQAKQPFLNPAEMANLNAAAVVAKVRNAAYAPLFLQVFGAGSLDDADQAYDRIVQAIAAFERTATFAPFTSKFDYFLKGQAQLTAQEMNGMALFSDPSKGNCAACHPIAPLADGTPPLFTDFTYDNLGVPRNPDSRFYTQGVGFNPDGMNFIDLGLGGALGIAAQNGRFKVPTLRNIAVTAPYMHNGYFTDLRSVVAFYNDRDVLPRCADATWTRAADARSRHCWPAPEVPETVNHIELGHLGLTDPEIDAIVAFLNTLSDGWQPSN
jgi:cytochrome c peroxidase